MSDTVMDRDIYPGPGHIRPVAKPRCFPPIRMGTQSGPERSRARQQARRSEPLTARTALRR